MFDPFERIPSRACRAWFMGYVMSTLNWRRLYWSPADIALILTLITRGTVVSIDPLNRSTPATCVPFVMTVEDEILVPDNPSVLTVISRSKTIESGAPVKDSDAKIAEPI